MQCKWPHELDADRPRFFSAVRRQSSAALNFVVVFDFFSAIFISWIIKDIRNAPHRGLEIMEVSEQGGSDPTRSTRHTHLENCHHWRRPSYNETDMQQWCQFQEPVRLLIAMALLEYLFMVTISSHLNLNFLKGSVDKKKFSFFSAFASVEKCKTEQPFVSGV